jgi:hypothetical protein
LIEQAVVLEADDPKGPNYIFDFVSVSGGIGICTDAEPIRSWS